MGNAELRSDDNPASPLPNFGDATMPIAVVGMACRYPGGATDPEKLWKMCAEQRDVWSPVPKERFNQDAFHHPDPSRNGTVRFFSFVSEPQS
jgi:acyl transferase domain-containing protein